LGDFLEQQQTYLHIYNKIAGHITFKNLDNKVHESKKIKAYTVYRKYKVTFIDVQFEADQAKR